MRISTRAVSVLSSSMDCRSWRVSPAAAQPDWLPLSNRTAMATPTPALAVIDTPVGGLASTPRRRRRRAARIRYEHPDHAVLSRCDKQLPVATAADVQVGPGER